MLRPRILASIFARSFVHVGSTRATSTTASSVRTRKNSLRTRYVCIGIGVVSAAGYFLDRHKVHADAYTNQLPRQSRGPVQLPDLAPGLRGIAYAQTCVAYSSLPKVIAVGTARINSTTLGEDRISITYYPFSTTLGYLAIGVYDGHSGANTVTELDHMLSDAVVGALADLYSQHAQMHAAMDVSSGVYLPAPGALPNPIPPDGEIDDAIRRVFGAVDTVLVHDAAQKALGLDDAAYAALQACNTPDAPAVLRPATGTIPPAQPLQESVRALSAAWSGSCALLGLFNTDDRSLRVALTGDSRAVLGRRVPTAQGGNYTYEAHPLTADQTALNPDEAARLTALHPDEPELLKNGRVVGWGCARAFGDGAMKWSRAVQARLHAAVLGDPPREACRTPPYFTAEPVITTRRDVRKGDFVVFATDGLWDCLTSEEAVGLVGRWLEDRGADARVVDEDGRTHIVRVPVDVDPPLESNRGVESTNTIAATKATTPKDIPPPPTPALNTYLPSELPVIFPPGYEDKTTMYKYWRAEKRFFCEDELVAVHLMRNALGGANKDLGLALLELPMPRARKYRDDISIAVIFFD